MTSLFGTFSLDEVAYANGHYAHSCDLLLTQITESDELIDPMLQALRHLKLAKSYRKIGRLRDALLAITQSLYLSPTFEAHFEEGAIWQDWDCVEAAAICFRNSLALQADYQPAVNGLSFCRTAQKGNTTKESSPARRKPSLRSTRLLGGGGGGSGSSSGSGGLFGGAGVASSDQMPVHLAESCLKYLNSKEASWRLNEKTNTGSASSAANQNVTAANMSYLMYIGKNLDDCFPDLRSTLTSMLQLQPHERLLINASKYVQGSYLSSHTDAPSGSNSYERVRAFVWHLSKDFCDTKKNKQGGSFVDEESGIKYAPKFNNLVSFSVPRWHSVDTITVGEATNISRISIYGWVVIPKIQLVSSSNSFNLMLYQHRMVALYWPGEEERGLDSGNDNDNDRDRDKNNRLMNVFGAAAHQPAPPSKSGVTGGAMAVTRGDYIKFCLATQSWKELEIKQGNTSMVDWPQEHSVSSVLLFVDGTLRDCVSACAVSSKSSKSLDSCHDDHLITMVNVLMNNAWSYMIRMSPILKSRNGREDRLCLSAMQFNDGLPSLAIVVGNTTASLHVNENVCTTVEGIMNTVGGGGKRHQKAFVYVTTNPRLCQAFGGITQKDTPTVVFHGVDALGASFQFRLMDCANVSFESVHVLNFVNGCCNALEEGVEKRVEVGKVVVEEEEEEEEEEGGNAEGIKSMMVAEDY